MNKLKIIAVLLIGFIAGETYTSYRASRYYKPRIATLETKNEKLQNHNKILRADVEVVRIRYQAWKTAARQLHRGLLFEEVNVQLDENLAFAKTLRQAL